MITHMSTMTITLDKMDVADGGQDLGPDLGPDRAPASSSPSSPLRPPSVDELGLRRERGEGQASAKRRRPVSRPR